MVIKILASIFTGIAGHFLNRRWDKAILFFSLFVLYLVVVYAFLMYSFQHISTATDNVAEEISNIYQLISRVFTIGILLLWLISLFITIADSMKNVEPTFTEWTKTGIFGAIIISVLSFALLAFTATYFFSLTGMQIADSDSIEYEADSFNTSSHNFFEYLHLGGSPSHEHKLPPTPGGEGILKGKISYQNSPAAGVTLGVVLNSKYRTKDIVTDSDGIFTISLPYGVWNINSIQTESWKNKPEEVEFTLFYGGEKKLTGNTYNRYASFKNKGYSVNITGNSDVIHFTATINKDIRLIWPDPETEAIKATIDDTIHWEEYPGAERYYVEIKKISREGSTTYYEPVTSKILNGATTLSLVDLKHIKTRNKENAEYAVEVYAFSGDDTLIAQFTDTFRGGTFLLSDGNILVEKQMDEFFDLTSNENPDEFEMKMEAITLNEKRGRAVSVLIDDNMLTEAEALMNLMDSEYSKGKKEVLAGYILALKGNCTKSNEMFNKAISINPDVCIPEEYKQKCE